jgi:hypothetical protein
MKKINDIFKATKENIELFKLVASKDKAVSMEAQEALAKVIAPVIEQVLPLLASSKALYVDFPYDAESNPTLPLEMFDNDNINTVRVWAQQTAGGLATSEIKPVGEYKFDTYRLDSAVSAAKKVAKDGQVNILAKMVERMTQEILRNQELTAWNVLMKAAGEALDDAGAAQTMLATTADVFQLDDFNRLKTKIARLHNAWNDGTPAVIGRKGLTDLFVSPEMMEQVRSWAYQPMNTRGVPDSAESTVIPLPDAIRTEIYRNAGLPSIYGIVLHELNEFGVNKAYNTLFDTYYSAAGGTFATSTQEVLLGVDLSIDAFIRPIATTVLEDIDVASTVTTMVDDQWSNREEKFGFYTKLQEGRVVLDTKAFFSLIV